MIKEAVVSLTKEQKILVASVGVVSAGVAGTVGYILGRRKQALEVDWEQIYEESEPDVSWVPEEEPTVIDPLEKPKLESIQIEEVDEPYNVFENSEEREQFVSDNYKEIEPYRSKEESTWFDEKNETWHVNPRDEDEVFVSWVELREAVGEPIYIIHETEFGENDDYASETLVYFKEDGVLVDSNDQPIDDSNKVIGPDENLKFGFLSNGHDTVYIRNETLEVDLEVLRDSGSYVEKILGFIEHEEKRPLKKFRGEYE